MKNKKNKGVVKKKIKLKLVEPKKTLAEKLNLKDETVHFSIAVGLIFLTIFFIASAFESAGPLGSFLYKYLYTFMGIGYYLLPVSSLIFAITFFKDIKKKFTKIKYFGVTLFLISGLGFIELVFENGGYLGFVIAKTQDYLGSPMAVVLSLIIIIISQVIIFDGIPKIKINKKEKREIEYSEELSEDEEKRILKSSSTSSELSEKKTQGLFGKKNETRDIPENKIERKEERSIFKISAFDKNKSKEENVAMTEKTKNSATMFSNEKVILPPTSMLSKDKGKVNAGDVKERANLIKSTLFSFGISVEIEAVSVGPTVTRYSLRPAIGVKVSKIAALSDDLALALAAKSIIIQTPIPGQSLVGIEIPNKTSSMVGAGSLFSSSEFQNSEFDIPLAIGRDIGGEVSVIGMEKTPHMLIAGATGAGKSVTVHAIINSMLFKHGPDSLKFILIDPKRVEMTLYEGIPHLLTPVIKDPKKAILALRWSINEMERRYEILENHGLQNIASYHSKVLEKFRLKKEDHSKNKGDIPEGGGATENPSPEAMPYIVIVIDELADIMQQYPKELESGIVSIAQKARAVGIHLILSTQRPSVNVVTGLIKANIPTRIALQVSSAIDSKTILDQGGAEKLLGKGDMLYMTGSMAKPLRVQSSFISETEIKSVVSFIKKTYKDVLGEEISLGNEAERAQEVSVFNSDISFDDDDFDSDPLLKDAVDEVIKSGKASTSYLQRKLGIGYARAAKLIDIMEEKNIVGPPNGSKPREVLQKGEE